MKPVADKYCQAELDNSGDKGYSVSFQVEALKDVHFSTGKLVDTPKGNRQFNYMFSLLAAFILLIALLNYINLSTAKATDRAKEVGVRKVNGARPAQLIRQFLLESFLLIFIAWVLALGIVLLALPYINNLLEVQLHMNWAGNALFLSSIFLLTVLLAGLYPALIQSRFNPHYHIEREMAAWPAGHYTKEGIDNSAVCDHRRPHHRHRRDLQPTAVHYPNRSRLCERSDS